MRAAAAGVQRFFIEIDVASALYSGEFCPRSLYGNTAIISFFLGPVPFTCKDYRSFSGNFIY